MARSGSSSAPMIEVRGTDALMHFAKELKASDRALMNAFRRDIRKILKPATDEAKKSAMKFPSHGSKWRTSGRGSLRAALVRSVDTQTRFTSATARISVRSSRSKFGRAFSGNPGSRNMLHIYAAGEAPWRHPRPKGGKARGTDYSNWYGQRGWNWVEAAVRPMTPELVEEIRELMGEYARRLANSAS